MTQDDVRAELVRELQRYAKDDLAPEPKPPQTNKQKLSTANRELAARRRAGRLHFRWKPTIISRKKNADGTLHMVSGLRLYLCLGRQTIAAWPQSDDGVCMALVQTKMFKPGDGLDLKPNKDNVHRMALRLRKALLKVEEGPRRKSARQQRTRLDIACRLGSYAPAKKR